MTGKIPLLATILIIVIFFGSTGCQNLNDIPAADKTDSVGPEMVSNLSVNVAITSATLSWTDPADSDLFGIKISVEPWESGRAAALSDGIMVAKDTGTYTINDLVSATTYLITVTPYDILLNAGTETKVLITTGTSENSTGTTLAIGQTYLPEDVSNLSYDINQDQSVTFTWNNPDVTGLTGTHVLISPSLASFTEYNFGSDITSVTLSGFVNSTIYTVTVRTMDASGYESYGESIKYFLPIVDAADAWYVNNPVMAHAGGGLLYSDPDTGVQTEYTYTDSRDAILTNYDTGFRAFEVDLDYTPYMTPVIVHDWGSFAYMTNIDTDTITLEEFQEARLYGLFTPLTLDDLLDLMITHSDMYVQIDSKNRAPNIWVPSLVSRCEAKGHTELLDRLIIEIYNEENYEEVNSLYAFKNYFFTEYLINNENDLTDAQHDDVIEFCVKNAIPVVGTHSYWLTKAIVDKYAKYNIKVIAYNGIADDISSFGLLKEMGCYGIQTDWVTPQEWKNY